MKKYPVLLKYYPVLLLFFFSAMLPGCEKKPAAMVNGEPISEKAVQLKMDERVRDHQERGASVDRAALRSAVLDQVISETLILQGAREANIAVSEEEVNRELQTIQQRLGEERYMRNLKDRSLSPEEFSHIVRDNIMKEKFIATLLPEISDEDIRSFYKKSPKPFIKPVSVQVRFIQAKFKLDADALMKEIENSGDFDKVADAAVEEDKFFVSDYGWTSLGLFSPEIDNALEKLEVGSHGGPYKGKEGYYIIRVKAREEERPKTFEEAKDEIRSILLERKRAAAVIHWVASRKKSSMIVVN